MAERYASFQRKRARRVRRDSEQALIQNIQNSKSAAGFKRFHSAFHFVCKREKSGAVITVDFHIIVGQVTAPRLCRDLALMQVDEDENFVGGEHFGRRFLREGNARAGTADSDAPLGRAEIHVHRVDVKIRVGIPDGAENSAPVGVLAEHRALDQRGADDALGHGDRGIEVGRAGTFTFDQLGRAFKSVKPVELIVAVLFGLYYFMV